MEGRLPAFEKDYPTPIMRRSAAPNYQLVTANGTNAPTLSSLEFIPLFVAGSKGAHLDFVRFRYATAAASGGTLTVRYIADASTPTTSGTALTNSVAIDATANTMYTGTIVTSANKIPANALVYADCVLGDGTTGACPPGLVIDYGYRTSTN